MEEVRLMNKNLIIILVLVIVVGGGAFFGGIQYQKSQRSSLRVGQFGQQGQFANRVGQQNGRPVSGSIIASDSGSITIKLQDGSSKIVLLSGDTIINKQTTGSKADLTNGEKVMVMGKENSDGSVTADTISLSPMFRGNEVTPTATK